MGGGASKQTRDEVPSVVTVPNKPLVAPLENLSVAELRLLIEETDLSHGNAVEKSDLVELARQIGPLEGLRVGALRRMLEVTGRTHEDCVSDTPNDDRSGCAHILTYTLGIRSANTSR